MFRLKLTAILLSLVARLGLSEPQYSIVDESSNRWLPDDTLLTGLNTIYNSLSQGLQDNDDKKKRPLSVIAAVIVEYLSSDLADEQAKLNSALNALSRKITTESNLEFDLAGDKQMKGKIPAENPNANKTDRDSRLLRRHDSKHLDVLDNNDIHIGDSNEKYFKYDFNSLTDQQTNMP